jgi:hypothetical protein
MNRIAVVVGVLFAPLLLSAAASGPARSLSDADVLKYASTLYDKAAVWNTRMVLGNLNGVDVVVEHPCSDVCPDHTVRVVRFAVLPGASCKAVGGVEKSLEIPEGIGVADKVFCFPRVLVEHWDAYIR